MAEGQAVNKKTKSLTPVRTKKLRNSWRLKKVKQYKSGKVRVVRIQSTAPHAHLIELGHEVVSGGRTRDADVHDRVQRSSKGNKVRRICGRKAICLKNQYPKQELNSKAAHRKCLTG